DLEFGPGGTIDDFDLHTTLANPVAQLRRQVPLQLFTTELLDARQQRTNRQFSPSVRKQDSPLFHLVFGIPFAHLHLISLAIAASRSNEQLFSDCPKAQKTDPEFTLHPAR